MLKKLEVIQTDNVYAIWPEMKICKNTDPPQEQAGEKKDRRQTYGGNGEEQDILRSLIPSKEHFFHRSDVVSQSQQCETPVTTRMLIFTVSINHINCIIAESWVYRPRRLSRLIHEISCTHNSGNKITEVKRKLFH